MIDLIQRKYFRTEIVRAYQNTRAQGLNLVPAVMVFPNQFMVSTHHEKLLCHLFGITVEHFENRDSKPL